jgi:hypothetical protein
MAAAFLSLFALDVFDEPLSARHTIPALAIHLVPTAVVLGALAIAWRREVIGGWVFVAIGLVYVLLPQARSHPDWVAIVAGPLWVTGALFFVSHAVRRQSATPSTP